MFREHTLRAVKPRKTVSRPAKQIQLESRKVARLEQRRPRTPAA